ncbi:MAG: hypothetical protein JW786_14475 [Desulfobacterales bacterium]|nr:hypothetical protein [Desulfobacterales bacterium]
MEKKLIKTINLKNNLILKAYDASKKIAADRWQITLLINIEIPIRETLAGRIDDAVGSIDEIIQALGANLIFEQKRTRNFIDAQEKEESLNTLYDSFLENSLAYLSHANFPKKFVLKKYKEYLDKNKWYR